MKTTIKRENDEFLVISLKHASGRTGHVNPPRTPKSWEIAYENGQKTRKCRVFDQALKHLSGLKLILNRPITPILWVITHENRHQTQKKQTFGQNPQTCKSPRNPKIMDNCP